MNEKKPRGRPRSFDANQTIRRSRDVFWDRGFSATSLDMLSAATQLNRPSLYGAFGDKEDLYLMTLESYRQESAVALKAALDPALPLRENLALVYQGALEIYLHGGLGQRGCLLIGTASVEAVEHSRVRDVLQRSLEQFDELVAERMAAAVAAGEMPSDSDPDLLAKLASAVMHSLAVRARAGDSREKLEELARSAIDMICGKA